MPLILKIILLLALVQGISGLLRALGWIQIGADLFGQGLLLLPFIGAVAIVRGFFISIIAFLYILFVIGAAMGKGWASWVCCAAAAINLFLVVAAFARGATVGEAILWSLIPVILLFYLFSETGRAELKFT